MPPRRKQHIKTSIANPKAAKGTVSHPATSFVFHQPPSSRLLILLFHDTISQHSALARIEAFYESRHEGQNFIPLEDARVRHLCKGYEGYNFPVSAVKAWLTAMKGIVESQVPENDKVATRTDPSPSDTLTSDPAPTAGLDAVPIEETPWWYPLVTPMERAVLTLLQDRGVLLEPVPPVEQEDVSPSATAIGGASTVVYTVSALAPPSLLVATTHEPYTALSPSDMRCLDTPVLSHESLHYIYHMSASYRRAVTAIWDSLSEKHRRIITHDLSMRNYDERVHIDEWQAYIGTRGGEKEFGNVVHDACKEAAKALTKAIKEAWDEIGENSRVA